MGGEPSAPHHTAPTRPPLPHQPRAEGRLLPPTGRPPHRRLSWRLPLRHPRRPHHPPLPATASFSRSVSFGVGSKCSFQWLSRNHGCGSVRRAAPRTKPVERRREPATGRGSSRRASPRWAGVAASAEGRAATRGNQVAPLASPHLTQS